MNRTCLWRVYGWMSKSVTLQNVASRRTQHQNGAFHLGPDLDVERGAILDAGMG